MISALAFFGTLGLMSYLSYRYELKQLSNDKDDFMFAEYQGR